MLGELLRQSFPDDYKVYAKTFKIMRSTLPDSRTGPWLAKALLWGLQTFLHVDAMDGEASVCAAFNGGYYQGIEERQDGLETAMVFPELKIAFP